MQRKFRNRTKSLTSLQILHVYYEYFLEGVFGKNNFSSKTGKGLILQNCFLDGSFFVQMTRTSRRSFGKPRLPQMPGLSQRGYIRSYHLFIMVHDYEAFLFLYPVLGIRSQVRGREYLFLNPHENVIQRQCTYKYKFINDLKLVSTFFSHCNRQNLLKIIIVCFKGIGT